MPEGETMNIKVSELASAIEKELTLQQKTSTEAVKKAAEESAREIREDIKEHAPVGKGPKSGTYRKSWRTRKTEETPTSISYVIHAGPSGYRLAHLLEFGHAKRGGGRTSEQPHIKPAEERGIRQFEEKIRRDLR